MDTNDVAIGKTIAFTKCPLNAQRHSINEWYTLHREGWLQGEKQTLPVPEDGPGDLLHLPQGGQKERGLAAAHLPHNHGQLAYGNGGQEMGRKLAGV